MRDIIQKTRKDYNKIAKHFSDTRKYVWTEFAQFKKYIKNGQNILDWGCGSGRLIFLLKDKKVNYFGVDQSIGLLKVARKNFVQEIKEGWVKFYCTAKKQKNFKKDFFDSVFMIASLFHLPNEKTRLALLKKSYSELKKNGNLFITVWNLESDWAKEKFNKDWKKIGENDFLIPWKNPQGKIECERYYHHFTKAELGDLLKKVGFKIKKMEYFEKNSWSDSKGGRNLIVIAKK